jgi:hypothetical protein
MSGSRFGMRPHSRAEGYQLEKFPTSFVGGWRWRQVSGSGAHLLRPFLHHREDSRRCWFCFRAEAPWPLRSDHDKGREERWAQHNREARHKGENRRRSAHPICGRQPLFGHRNSLNKKMELKLTATSDTPTATHPRDDQSSSQGRQICVSERNGWRQVASDTGWSEFWRMPAARRPGR